MAASLAGLALAVAILTSQYDNARTGANLNESVLTPANVNSGQFGKLFAMRVDGDIYAQPLYVPNLDIPGKGKHNVLFVATGHDSVYAFDADRVGEPLWRVSLIGNGETTVPAHDVQCPFIAPEIGITPTPVIDYQSGTLYVLARTKESRSRHPQRLHALAITTGAEKFGGPVEIKAPGFDPLRELPRAGLLLTNGQVILTWGSSCDVGPYHGWVMAYDTHTLAQTAVLNTSPSAGQSGIWQSDCAPAVDSDGNVYVATGNGRFTGKGDYGDSLLRLGNHLSITDYFTPFNERELNADDADFGSGGPVVLPDHHLVLVGAKDGGLYLLDRDHLGKYQSGSNSHALQVIRFRDGIYAAPAYWNGHVFVLPSADYLSDFALQKGRLSSAPVAVSTHRFGNPGATPAISAKGSRNGIVWVIETKAWNDHSNRPAVLHAYDATNVAHELFRDSVGPALRFTIPTVANGRVYVEAKGAVAVYGLR